MIDDLQARLDQIEMKYIWLAGLGGLAAVALVTIFMPGIVALAMIALILPGIAMLAATALLPYYAIGLGIGALTKGWTRIVAITVTLTVAGITPPLIANRAVIAQGKALAAGDHAAPLPRDRRYIAFLLPARVAQNSFDDTDTGCGQYCQRLLFSGEAQAVLVGTSRARDDAPDPQMPVTRFRLEQRQDCPPVDLRTADSGWPEWAGPKMTMNVALSIANGRCLIRDMVRLNSAQVIVRDRQLAFAAPVDGHGRPLVRAQRLEIFGMADGTPVELVRHTQVETRPLIVPWVWTRDFFSGLDSEMAFLRRTQTSGSYDLTDALRAAGLTFADPQETEVPSDTWPLRTKLEQGLADPKAVAGDPRLALASQYLKAVADLGPVDRQEAAVVAKVAADARIADSERVYLKEALEKLVR